MAALLGILLGAAAGLVVGWAVTHRRWSLPVEKSDAATRTVSETAEAGGETTASKLRRERAADRRRVRQAQRRERRAERVLAMARCLIGCDWVDLGVRSSRAVVDNFGADTASLWLITGERPIKLGEAARRDASAPEPTWPGESESGGAAARGAETSEFESEMPAASASGMPAASASGMPAASASGMPASRTEWGGCVHYLPLRDEARRTVAFLVVGFNLAQRRRPPGIEAYAAFLGQILAIEIARSPTVVGNGAPADAIAV
jgi:hypothetical protein